MKYGKIKNIAQNWSKDKQLPASRDELIYMLAKFGIHARKIPDKPCDGSNFRTCERWANFTMNECCSKNCPDY